MLIVDKYGGTSVADAERIEKVAANAAATRAAGHDWVVVVSAMAGETDRLLQMSRALNAAAPKREVDALLATGEVRTSALLVMALQARTVAARSYNGAQVPVVTDSVHGRARIARIETAALRRDIAAGTVPVVAGFQGVDEAGNVTTLGRGGSDTTAVALAAALGAGECRIYTDVDGVYTADPRIVPEARCIPRITMEEMLELARSGARVLQTRSVELVGKYRVPLRVLSSFAPGAGTLITCEEKKMEQPLITGLAYSNNEAKLTIRGVPDKPGVARQILSPIAEAHINVDMIIQNVGVDGTTDLTFTVERSDYKIGMEKLREAALTLAARDVLGDPAIAKISVVGVGMRSHAGIAARMFSALADQGINIQMISTSEIKISVAIEDRHLESAMRALHREFRLGDDRPPET